MTQDSVRPGHRPLFLRKRIGRIKDEAASIAEVEFRRVCRLRRHLRCGFAVCVRYRAVAVPVGFATRPPFQSNSSKSSRQIAWGGTSMGSIV